jgi:hypothetical protein
MKALLKLRTQMEIDFLKTKTYEEINDMFNQLKDKLDIAESELKKLRVTDVSVSVCDCGNYSVEAYAPCCSLSCWHEKYE